MNIEDVQLVAHTHSAFSYKDGSLKLAKMAEPLAIRWSCPLPEKANPSPVTISRDQTTTILQPVKACISGTQAEVWTGHKWERKNSL